MKIKNIEINDGAFLAPMASVTDKPFRTLCKMLGASLTYTEMVSVKGLYYNSKKTEQLLSISKLEHPCAVQLFGHEPEIFKSVIESGVLDKFDIIDINMGCPAPKIVKNGDGSALMKDINLASEIIKACRSATNKPITVKFRKGFYKNDDKLIEFAKMCEASGADAITIHPRTRESMFSGSIDIEDIKKVKESVNIVVIGNGDVIDINSYNKMKQACDAVMIGRETLKKPEIFMQILLDNKLNLNNITFFNYYNKFVEEHKIEDSIICTENNNMPTKLQIIKMHLALLKQEYGEEHITRIFKRYILAYLSNFKNANSLKKEIVFVKELKTMENMIYNFIEKLYNSEVDDN